MKYRDFVYWLQGYLEVSGSKTLDEKQVEIIQAHLNNAINKGAKNDGGGGGC